MTSEQLQNVRAERWRQTSNPVLTADDAKAWISGVGFCLFLPRRAHFATPGPSFVEAVVGAPSDAPSREAMENATALLHRLTADGVIVPLNLFGAGGASVFGGVDQPDFLVTREALPYVFSLIGGRNWKSGPGGKASPLMTEIWTLLHEEGSLTAQEIQTALGRELTEAAVLRALVELWNGLRAIPVYDGETTRWELTQTRFAGEMSASQKVAQTTALSALVSLYLEAALAASSDEIETFLSPLTARSRVREVVNGLQATRQLGLVSVGAQPLLHVAGSLPEFAEAEPTEVRPRGGEIERAEGFERKPRVERERGLERKPFVERKPFERAARREDRGFDRGRGKFERGPSRERTGPPREKAPRERTSYERPGGKRFAAERGGDAGFRSKSGGERGYRGSEDRVREGRQRDDQRREGRPYSKKPFDKTAKSYGERGGFERPRSFDRERTEPRRERGEGERPFRPRREEDRGERPFRPRREEDRGERRAGKFGGEKKFGGPKKFGGEKKFGGPKKFGGAKFERPKFEKRGEGGVRDASRPARGSFGFKRESAGEFKRERTGEKRPFFRERPARERDHGPGERGFRSEKREGGWKMKAGREGAPRQGKPEFRGSGKAEFKGGGKAGFKKTGFGKSGKPFGKTGNKAGKPFGKSGKPGGFKPPFRKRKEEGSQNGE